MDYNRCHSLARIDHGGPAWCVMGCGDGTAPGGDGSSVRCPFDIYSLCKSSLNTPLPKRAHSYEREIFWEKKIRLRPPATELFIQPHGMSVEWKHAHFRAPGGSMFACATVSGGGKGCFLLIRQSVLLQSPDPPILPSTITLPHLPITYI